MALRICPTCGSGLAPHEVWCPQCRTKPKRRFSSGAAVIALALVGAFVGCCLIFTD